MTAQLALLSGNRLHFQHGPIDLVIGAEGERNAVQAAHAAAWERFSGLLAELVEELPALRAPVSLVCPLRGPVARRMWHACAPFRPEFITPMAAVAGSVADEIIAFYRREGVTRAWVNNGGDIAVHLAPGTAVRIGLLADPDPARCAARESLDGRFTLDAQSPARGIATSGWQGRSFSLGIADSVTVLARSASVADAAATMIANAVNIDDPRIVRQPANTLKDDTDLGDRCVTVEVPALAHDAIGSALQAGLVRANALRAAGLIEAAVLVCQGQVGATPRDAMPDARERALGSSAPSSKSGEFSVLDALPGTTLASKPSAPKWHRE
jgi:ApbE superfamily uncharacterized protein (UPF0280 family)